MPLVRFRCVTIVIVALVGCLLGANAAAVRAADDYEIKLVRPPKVGQKYTVTVEGALVRTSTLKVNGQLAGKSDMGYGVVLEGTVEVLVVNTDGEEGKAACTVKRCVRVMPEGEQELVPAGRVVTAEGGKDDTTFTVDQGELSDEAKEALGLVFRMGEEDGFNDDKIYGTTQRQPVGGTWPVNQQAASEEGKADKFMFEPSDIVASLKIEGVEKVGEVECLRIGGQTEIKKFTSEAPEGMTFDTGSLKAKYSGLFPVDVNVGVLAETMSVSHAVSYKGKNEAGQDTLIESKMQRATEMKRTFLP